MTIVLNENEWAEEMISSRTLGKSPTETLRRVARYYLDMGRQKKEVRKLLEEFLLMCNPGTSIPKWSETVERAISKAQKRPAVNVDGIDISRAEMERIAAVEGAQTQRLAFTLLCLSKYWRIARGMENPWVGNKDSDIMRMANIATSVKRQSQMYRRLADLGLIRLSRRIDSTGVQVAFETDGDTALTVTDFRNLGYQYMMYYGGSYYVCSNCGITTRLEKNQRGPKRKYCPDCAMQVHLQQRVNSVMRSRGKPVEAV